MEQPQVSAAAIKLPAFWPADPELWFAQVEAQFTTRNITVDDTKYNYLVASLTAETAAEVRDLLITPPAADKYKTLKDAIITRTTSSAQARFKQLLTAEELEGRKPTQLLRRMKQLIGTNAGLVSDDLLKQLFVQRMPTQAQVVLASSDNLTLDKMAEMADKIVEVVSPQISAIQGNDQVADLRKEIEELKTLIRGRNKDRQQNNGHRSRSKTPTPGSRAADNTEDQQYCWFHYKFGDNAKKCRSPCSYQPGNASGSR